MADGRLEVFRRALLGRDFFAHVAPLRSRPGVASIIWESLVSIGGRSREHFADNRSAHYLFIYIDIKGTSQGWPGDVSVTDLPCPCRLSAMYNVQRNAAKCWQM